MPIQILWGSDLNACDKFIQKLIDKKVSTHWRELNISYLNGNDENQVKKALEEVLTPPFGEGSRLIVLKNNPIFTNKSDEFRLRLEKIYKNIPNNTYLILQNFKKPDSRLKSTKFIKNLIKENLASEISFSLPDVWDNEGQKRYLEDTANSMNLKLDQGVAQMIIDSIGNDSYNLMNELNKAKIYLSALRDKDNSQLLLNKDHIKQIFNDHQSNIFKVIDFLLQKKINESLFEINWLLEKGEPALRLNAGLISQIRIHTIVKLLDQNSGNDTATICDLANISNPKRIFFIKQKVKNIPKYFLIKLMSNLLNIDLLLKQGNNPFSVFAENLVNLS